MATIRQVAKLAGVSITTVSRILNNDENFLVSDKTKVKVLDAVKKLDYKRKNVKKSKNGINISIIKAFDEKIEIEDPYFISLKIDLENILKKNGIKSKFFNFDVLKKDKNQKISEFVTNNAIVVLGEIRSSHLEFLKSMNENIICVDAYNPENNVDYIKFDTKNSVELVINYLVKLNHKKIGFLGARNQFVKNLVDFREKYFVEITKNLNIFNENFFKIDNFSAESGYIMAKQLLKLNDIPTAIFCANDSIAIGAYKAIREKNMEIGKDISIVGFNDLKISKYLNPPLTTIRVNTKIIAKETVNVLMELIENKRDYRKKVYLPIELVERESCQKV